MLRLFPGLVRAPDVAFLSWARLPDRRVPLQAIPAASPDLAVEVLSKSNTPAEMARKRGEYFGSGVRLVWEVEPDDRTVAVYDAPDRFDLLRGADALDGRDVLPGFTLPLRDLFAGLDRTGTNP